MKTQEEEEEEEVSEGFRNLIFSSFSILSAQHLPRLPIGNVREGVAEEGADEGAKGVIVWCFYGFILSVLFLRLVHYHIPGVVCGLAHCLC